jgi:hypothetical protein
MRKSMIQDSRFKIQDSRFKIQDSIKITLPVRTMTDKEKRPSDLQGRP